MKLSEFDYELPENLIAQEPILRRDQARLMVIDRLTRTIRHDIFANLGRYLPSESVLVVNNSRVVPARLLGTKRRSGGKVEIFLLEKLPDGLSYRVMLRPCRKIHNGDEIAFNGSPVVATIVDKDQRIVRFNHKDVMRHLKDIGHIPLPPYIKRQDTPQDHEYYQTVYARYAGSVAAPTAGLHFTPELLGRMKSEGHRVEMILLHVNYATFKPVEHENIAQHPMHAEDYSVSPRAWARLTQYRRTGRRIVAVGTTSCRALEAVALSGRLRGRTEIFLRPGSRFHMTDALITNFHLPRSTLLMMVYAFGQTALMRRAYQEAIRERYRFYSYGDGMLIL